MKREAEREMRGADRVSESARMRAQEVRQNLGNLGGKEEKRKRRNTVDEAGCAYGAELPHHANE